MIEKIKKLRKGYEQKLQNIMDIHRKAIHLIERVDDRNTALCYEQFIIDLMILEQGGKK